MDICSACKKRVSNTVGSVKFKCPSCAGSEIIRCSHCRDISAKYECSNCGFSGPN